MAACSRPPSPAASAPDASGQASANARIGQMFGGRGGSALDSEPTLRMAQSAVEVGTPMIALNVTTNMLRRDPYNIPAVTVMGRALLSTGDYARAATAFRLVTRIRPGNAAAHFDLGRCLILLRDYKAANAEFQRSVALEERPEPLADLGVVQALLGQTSEAEQSLRRSLELNPDSAATRRNLDLLLQSEGKPTESDELVKPASYEQTGAAPAPVTAAPLAAPAAVNPPAAAP